jgi:hypothetical protein
VETPPEPRAAEPRTGDRRGDDEPVLPATSGDERDVGWGADPDAGQRDAEWFRRERPPHHE